MSTTNTDALGDIAFIAYSAVRRQGKKISWQPIGEAFAHRDADGLNVNLYALPLDGKFVLRRPKSGDNEIGLEGQTIGDASANFESDDRRS